MLTLEKNTGFKTGGVTLPASKSLSNRALIIRELCKKSFEIHDLSGSDDTQNLIQQLGSGKSLMDVGAAGTNMRFLISLLSITDCTKILTGSERMLKRPVRELVDSLRSIGADIEYLDKEGFPPIRIKGKKLNGGKVTIEGSISSQFISSLLMIAPSMEQGLELEITGKIVSAPYIQMTLSMMEYFGIQHFRENNRIVIQPQSYVARDYRVEGDWSAAGFWYGFIACSAPGTSIHFENLETDSWQGDKNTSLHYRSLGVETIEPGKGITIKKRETEIHKELSFDLMNEPDLFPALAFTCATLKIPAYFTGLETLNLKESKRIETIALEIAKTGAISETTQNSLKITGFTSEQAQQVFDTHHDHRIAMAAAIYAMQGKPVNIRDPEVVSKSYPTFWEDLKNIGIVNIY